MQEIYSSREKEVTTKNETVLEKKGVKLKIIGRREMISGIINSGNEGVSEKSTDEH